MIYYHDNGYEWEDVVDDFSLDVTMYENFTLDSIIDTINRCAN